MGKRKLRTRPVALPTEAQLEAAMTFLAGQIAAEGSVLLLEKEDRKAPRKALREQYREWENGPDNAGLDDDGRYALQHTARSVIQRLESIRNDQKVMTDATHWRYTSPLNGLTRPFSRALDGLIFTFSEVKGIYNGQLPNTLLSAGGWCSRGTWELTYEPRRGQPSCIGKRGTQRDIEKANAAAMLPWWEWASDQDENGNPIE